MNLFLNSGDMVTLHNLDSFENFIEEQLGSDVMIVFRNMINNQIGEIENLQVDYDIQCESTKNLDSARQQAMEELENTIDYIGECKRIDRSKIINQLKEIYDILDSVEY